MEGAASVLGLPVSGGALELDAKYHVGMAGADLYTRTYVVWEEYRKALDPHVDTWLALGGSKQSKATPPLPSTQTCPICGNAAYVGLFAVECTHALCRHYKPVQAG